LFDFDDQTSTTQDFVMINHPVFFAANVKDFLRLQTVREEMSSNTLKAADALTGGDLNPLHWHWREIMNIAKIAGKPPAHPASNTYYSMSPIRYGNYLAKVRVKPAADQSHSWLEMLARLATESDAMRLALEKTLKSESVAFEFQVQLRTSEQSMPIEDATIEWPESESPYRTVAHLKFHQQDIEPLRDQNEYKHLGFSVWNCLVAHRPLGGINRIRRVVYPMSANWRRL
jgi:catalase